MWDREHQWWCNLFLLVIRYRLRCVTITVNILKSKHYVSVYVKTFPWVNRKLLPKGYVKVSGDREKVDILDGTSHVACKCKCGYGDGIKNTTLVCVPQYQNQEEKKGGECFTLGIKERSWGTVCWSRRVEGGYAFRPCVVSKAITPHCIWDGGRGVASAWMHSVTWQVMLKLSPYIGCWWKTIHRRAALYEAWRRCVSGSRPPPQTYQGRGGGRGHATHRISRGCRNPGIPSGGTSINKKYEPYSPECQAGVLMQCGN